MVNGKPAPDCFVHLAERMGIDPADCLVIEDAPAGVAAATAAGMRVVAVPSMLQKGGKPSAQYPAPTTGAAAGCVALLPSLLEFRPEEYGLPPFQGACASGGARSRGGRAGKAGRSALCWAVLGGGAGRGRGQQGRDRRHHPLLVASEVQLRAQCLWPPGAGSWCRGQRAAGGAGTHMPAPTALPLPAGCCPAAADRIGETIPLHPLIYIRGTVVKGFGRGSRELGIPTANVDADSLRTALAEAVTGAAGPRGREVPRQRACVLRWRMHTARRWNVFWSSRRGALLVTERLRGRAEAGAVRAGCLALPRRHLRWLVLGWRLPGCVQDGAFHRVEPRVR